VRLLDRGDILNKDAGVWPISGIELVRDESIRGIKGVLAYRHDRKVTETDG